MSDKRIIIVTGGSQNIGLAIAREFASQSDHVIVADLQSAEDASLEFFKTDVSDEASVKALMAHVQSAHGRLDVIINNAGIAVETSIVDTTAEDWDRVMAINARGPFFMCKHAFPIMSNGKAPSPAIVNISSIEGLGANPKHSAYAASKGAVASFTHNVALEFGPHGIRCNAIAPGWINTPFNENLLNQYPDRAKVDAEIKSLHPIGRLGLPEDIANTAYYLASDKAGFISGQEITVAGGRMAKLPTPAL